MITKAIAVAAKRGDIFEHTVFRNADGTPLRARVNGKCRTWVFRPDIFRLPMKHGLRDCFYINPMNASQWRKT